MHVLPLMVIVAKLLHYCCLMELPGLFYWLQRFLYYSNEIDVCITFATHGLIKEYYRLHFEKDSLDGVYKSPLLVFLLSGPINLAEEGTHIL